MRAILTFAIFSTDKYFSPKLMHASQRETDFMNFFIYFLAIFFLYAGFEMFNFLFSFGSASGLYGNSFGSEVANDFLHSSSRLEERGRRAKKKKSQSRLIFSGHLPRGFLRTPCTLGHLLDGGEPAQTP